MYRKKYICIEKKKVLMEKMHTWATQKNKEPSR